MKSFFLKILVFGFSTFSLSAQELQSKMDQDESIIFKPELKSIFENLGVKGSTSIYDLNNQTWILTDSIEFKRQTLPASTFKIINLLIALETGVIESELDVIKWHGISDSLKYGYRPDIYRDITIKEAFEVSAVWVFIELANKIGKETYRKFLNDAGYGNLKIDQEDVDFWNFGDFAISPREQIVFLKNIFEGNTQFSKNNVEILKGLMFSESFADANFYGKTGWTRLEDMHIGWWVGFLERNGNIYFFATRIFLDRGFDSKNFASNRRKITNQVFENLKII
ncbi:MAG TPA: penicillin-binding transpeptidase domain-containing protein [Cyclobacteriaceae bacterium]|nr:penicillin-binding transpeptidase domain-containing protein [Cyclobacteriaceae bacterium]